MLIVIKIIIIRRAKKFSPSSREGKRRRTRRGK
jgi:hypothetical protein